MSKIMTNDLETRGVSAVEEALANDDAAIISVQGEPRYVVIDVARYTHLRECELNVALAESRADRDAGLMVNESAVSHVGRLCASS
jgi:hypothetical protein